MTSDADTWHIICWWLTDHSLTCCVYVCLTDWMKVEQRVEPAKKAAQVLYKKLQGCMQSQLGLEAEKRMVLNHLCPWENSWKVFDALQEVVSSAFVFTEKAPPYAAVHQHGREPQRLWRRVVYQVQLSIQPSLHALTRTLDCSHMNISWLDSCFQFWVKEKEDPLCCLCILILVSYLYFWGFEALQYTLLIVIRFSSCCTSIVFTVVSYMHYDGCWLCLCVCGRRVLEMCCFMEKMLASMLADFEMKVEKAVLEPLNKLSEVSTTHIVRTACHW